MLSVNVQNAMAELGQVDVLIEMVIRCMVRDPEDLKNKAWYTNCNCITKDALKRFLKMQTEERETCDWILNVVIPQAEAQFFGVEEPTPPKERAAPPTAPPTATSYEAAVTQIGQMLDQIDQLIITAITLRRELLTR